MTKLVPAVFAVAALSVSACSSPGICPCPFGGLYVDLNNSDPIASVSTDLPCRAEINSPGTVHVWRANPGTCQVRADLTNGDTYTFSYEVREVGTGCCEGRLGVVDASVPTLVEADAGAGG